MDGTCAFCGEHKSLKDSHVLPAFVYRWLRTRSGTGHIRNTENANRRVQDGLKFPWLCGDCESQFNRYETPFATKIFHPWHSGEYRIAYEEWLLKFCVSVSWRVLKFARGRNKNVPYSNVQQTLMDSAEVRWRAFLKNEVPHPAEFEIQKGPNQWDGTKIHVKHGLLKPSEISVPAGLLDLFREKAENVATTMSNISSVQRAKIDKHILDNLDAFAESDQFASIRADALMFGEHAVLWKDES
jgi:hypothetical protein